ncbi:MAG: hypothetical protein Q9221_000155 [Calogaya cf. arnoldii]
MELYGGPICYLILQIFIFFGILLWWDSVISPFALLAKKTSKLSSTPDFELAQPTISPSLNSEIAFTKPTSSSLRVLHLSKTFGHGRKAKKTAVDDLAFKISPSEIFALLGAGKSTAISLIRGDMPPSSIPHHDPSILIDTTSILTHRSAARARLGVCPQFDASDTLTVTESLHFYARVRGVADSAAHNISACISAFGTPTLRAPTFYQTMPAARNANLLL